MLPSHVVHTSLSRNRSVPLQRESFFVPSSSLWGESELSVAPIQIPHFSKERSRLSYHLTSLFPSIVVDRVMEKSPQCTDPLILCQNILAEMAPA